MRTHTVTEYDKRYYDYYENNITLTEIIDNLEAIDSGYIGRCEFTGEEDDFERFKLHISLHKAIGMLRGIMETRR